MANSRPVDTTGSKDAGTAKRSDSQAQSLSPLLASIAILLGLLAWYMLNGDDARSWPAPTVSIKQGNLIGKYIDDGSFPEPLEGFMGIPYALPPVGQRRFRPAEHVPASNETIEAYYLGPRCPGIQLVPFLKDPVLGPDYESEDCLTINVWRKKGHTEAMAKLPVAVLLPGGAFNRGAARMHNTHTMLAFSEQPYIAVSMQYRIGVFGGLNNELTENEGVLNLGLKDIYTALEWVQENIESFGGNPDDVTIMGLSAAAHAIGHLIMDINQPKKLFHKAILDSGAHTARAVHLPDAPLNKQHFREFLDLTPCAGFSDLKDPGILTCLRDLPSETVDLAGKEVFARSDKTIRWAWQPVIDGDVISRRPLEAWQSGKFNRVPILTGSAHNEGAYYVPRFVDKPDEFTGFFKSLLPHLEDAEIQELERLYPDPLVDPLSPYIDTRGIPGVGSQFRRLETAYGHYAYTCPVRQTVIWATSHENAAPAYLYHWALNKTALYGANHGDQMRYQTYNKEVRKISKAQDEVAGNFHAYCTSFITQGGNPNAIRIGKFAKRPEWTSFEKGDGLTMVLGKGNDERAGGSGVGVAANLHNYTWGQEQCDFWWKISAKWEH